MRVSDFVQHQCSKLSAINIKKNKNYKKNRKYFQQKNLVEQKFNIFKSNNKPPPYSFFPTISGKLSHLGQYKSHQHRRNGSQYIGWTLFQLYCPLTKGSLPAGYGNRWAGVKVITTGHKENPYTLVPSMVFFDKWFFSAQNTVIGWQLKSNVGVCWVGLASRWAHHQLCQLRNSRIMPWKGEANGSKCNIKTKLTVTERILGWLECLLYSSSSIQYQATCG